MGLGIDIGTSGIRVQAIDLEKGRIIATAITLRHPLPGANVMDHLQFSLESGIDIAHALLVKTINRVIKSLDISLSEIKRVGVCGNPTQLSIFQGAEYRDLAFAGEQKLEELQVGEVKRDKKIIDSRDIGLEIDAEVYIPPAIKHEVGADALAMLIKSGILEKKECSIVTDYGTNAEIALKVGDDVYTGSCAAGPAIEGQEIEKGMLAAPGAISDVNLNPKGDNWECVVLDEEIMGRNSFAVDPNTGEIVVKHGAYEKVKPKGITGTGTIGIITIGFKSGIIQRKPPYITTNDIKIYMHDESIYFTENDYIEATRAFGAFRAGHKALFSAAGISFDTIKSAYMCGAGGTYVDANKTQILGLTPPTALNIYQIGNTSLSMAVDIVMDSEWLDKMQEFTSQLRASHVMFAKSPVFKSAYVLEMDYWEKEISEEKRKKYEKFFNLPYYPEKITPPEIHRVVVRDIPILGKKGLRVVNHCGTLLIGSFEGCKECKRCEEVCMEGALKVIEEGDANVKIKVETDKCDGFACIRCEKECKEGVFKFNELKIWCGKDNERN